jgi:hypothetical protein
MASLLPPTSRTWEDDLYLAMHGKPDKAELRGAGSVRSGSQIKTWEAQNLGRPEKGQVDQ